MKLIAELWDDLLRPAGSLKLAFVHAAGLTRTLQTTIVRHGLHVLSRNSDV